MNNTFKLLSIGTIILILLATIPISTAKKTFDDIQLPIAIREKAENFIKGNIQPQPPQPTQLIVLIVLLILILVFSGIIS
ncbi:MAG: hypothetical protein JSW06_02010 [Thermoplasmatales archaeon]|nr:MAG: hypothetical protein JSW06_02010 [Thermoplasmatales archaeon]